MFRLLFIYILGPQLVLSTNWYMIKEHNTSLHSHDASHEAQSSSSSSSQQRQPARPVTFSRVVSRRPAQKFARAPILLGAAPRLGDPASTSGGTISGPRARAAANRAPAAASRAVAPCAAGRGPGVGCRKIDRPVSGAGRGRENRAAPYSAATVSGADRWAGAGGRCSPYGPACTSDRYGSGARCSMGASAKVIFGTVLLEFD